MNGDAMTDGARTGESDQRDEAPDRPEGAVASPSAAEEDVAALRSTLRWIGFGIVIYFFAAIGLVFEGLRRGRLFDAILLVVTWLVTMPMILGYRKQVRGRLRTLLGVPATDPPRGAAAPEAAASGPGESEGG